jgi:hypothetical protein
VQPRRSALDGEQHPIAGDTLESVGAGALVRRPWRSLWQRDRLRANCLGHALSRREKGGCAEAHLGDEVTPERPVGPRAVEHE